MTTIRVALVADLLEENWSSMDLVGNMLEQNLNATIPNLQVVRLCPPMHRRFTTKTHSDSPRLFNADRLLNRFWDYPRWLRTKLHDFDLFHIVDHSYSQLVHHLPPGRAMVTCHDLDTFRCILHPDQEKRNPAFRAMAKRILNGLRKAAWVTCDSAATQHNLLTHKLVPDHQVSIVLNGVHPAYFNEPDAEAKAAASRLLGPPRPNDLLHVGSTIARKRIDVLLKTFARVRETFPGARLIRVGGPFTPEQTALALSLKVADAILILPRIETSVLGAVYRRATLSLLTSEREGFGLPLAESMACGTPVVASDLPVLREVGGAAAEYCAIADIEAWSQTVTSLLNEHSKNQTAWARRQERSLRRASEFTWAEYARRMAEIYFRILAHHDRKTKGVAI